MSQDRRSPRGHDLYLDVWHRKDSLSRFVGSQRAHWMSMIDIDCCEYCFLGGCFQPVALIETKLIISTEKTMTVTENLAHRANLPAYLVEYAPTRDSISCETCGRPDASPENDIEYFVINGTDEKTPAQYAEWLWSLRVTHWRSECSNPASQRMLAMMPAVA